MGGVRDGSHIVIDQTNDENLLPILNVSHFTCLEVSLFTLGTHWSVGKVLSTTTKGQPGRVRGLRWDKTKGGSY